MFTVERGFCYHIHDARPRRFECFGSFINMFKGLLCFVMFIYILRKMFKNHRRALAGYTKNTISIDVHMTMMFTVGFWTILWGATKVFDVSNNEEDNSANKSETRLLVFTISMCYAVSSLCELVIILLFCSRSIGKNNFQRFWMLGGSWAAITFFSMFITEMTTPGVETTYFLGSGLQLLIAIRSLVTALFAILSFVFFYATKSDRYSILMFSGYLLPINALLCLSQGLTLSTTYLSVNIGICLMDFFEMIHFFAFPAVCYFALKRDCQYWSVGVDQDEEDHMLQNANEEAWSEMPNYQELVIPKTELFYRKMIVETVDMSVEVHLWRRKFACVKRFKFDLLTRDNIKFFKDEANIFKQIAHENIVEFYGILIDPPSLGIVMQFCPNSDVFKQIEKRRKDLIEKRVGNNPSSSVSALHDVPRISTERQSAIKEKEIEMLTKGTFCQTAVSLSIYEEHLVHSALSREEDLKALQSASRMSDESKDDLSRPHSLRVSNMRHFISWRNLEKSITSFEPLLIALQVAKGMAYLHSKEITHRDLKSLNVLLDEKFQAKIADFGESSFGEISSSGGQSSFREMGTPGWAAPELLLGESVSKASDVFSFGIILWELMTFRAPSILITVETLQLPSVCNLPSTYEHPLLKEIALEKSTSTTPLNNLFSDKTRFFEKRPTLNPLNNLINPTAPVAESSKSTPSNNAKRSSAALNFQNESTNSTPDNNRKRKISVQDDDLTMIEVGDAHTARALMCDLHARPPMPYDISPIFRKILSSCWCIHEANRPHFSEIFSALEKLLTSGEFEKVDIPCEVEASVNIASDVPHRKASAFFFSGSEGQQSEPQRKVSGVFSAAITEDLSEFQKSGSLGGNSLDEKVVSKVDASDDNVNGFDNGLSSTDSM